MVQNVEYESPRRRKGPPPPPWHDDESGSRYTPPVAVPKSAKRWRLFCFIAFGLIFTAILFYGIVQMVGSPNEEDYDKVADYEDALGTYNTAMRVLTAIGNFFLSVGVVLLSLSLFIGGISDRSLPDNARVGMFVAAGLIMGLFVLSGLGFHDFTPTDYVPGG